MESTIVKRIQEGKFTLIGEIGVNYYDIAKEHGLTPMEGAKRMLQQAKEAGIHAVKFQTYRAETLASRKSPSYWDTREEATRSQYELFRKYDSFGPKEYEELAAYCQELGIEFCSTAFDVESADYLEPLMQVYKISSSDLTNLPFIAHQAKKQKPILLSVGASNLDEIQRAVDTIRKYNHQLLVLLHCVLEYPTPYAHANLNKIAALRQQFPHLAVGYSDHTRPDDCCDVIKTAYLLGAQVVEKHFTLNKSLPGNDHYHAMDPQDAKRILQGIQFVQSLRGSYALTNLDTEDAARTNARRSLVAQGNIPKGSVITREMLTFKRPGTGISPSRMDEVIGRRAAQDIPDDTTMTWEMLE